MIYAKSLEEFDAIAAKERAKLAAELETRATLPGSPAHILKQKDFTWVSYDAKTLDDALAILELFPQGFREVSARTTSCTSVQPVGYHSKEYAKDSAKVKFELDQCIEFRQSGGKGFRSDELIAYPDDTDLRVTVRFQPDYRLRASLSCRYDRLGNVVHGSVEFRDSPLSRLADARLKFNGGGDDGFDVRYYFDGVDNLRQACAQVLGAK